jgi:hypothetical protein
MNKPTTMDAGQQTLSRGDEELQLSPVVSPVRKAARLALNRLNARQPSSSRLNLPSSRERKLLQNLNNLLTNGLP